MPINKEDKNDHGILLINSKSFIFYPNDLYSPLIKIKIKYILDDKICYDEEL